MKTLITFFFIIFVSTSFAQELSYEDIQGKKRREVTKEFDLNFNGNLSAYRSKEGHTYKIGDTLTIGKAFSDKTFYEYLFSFSWLSIVRVARGQQNNKIVIKKIYVGGNGNNLHVNFRTTGNTSFDNFFFRIDQAIDAGEIQRDYMTEDKAIKKLKKYKEKLDLGIITQQKYDSIFNSLQPYFE